MKNFRFPFRKKYVVETRAIEKDREYILNDNTLFSTTEEYKTLRTNIIFSLPENECKVVGVISSNIAEGKSINCLNLAIAFAQTSAKVLILDCDLRLPRSSGLLNIKATPGISNILAGMNRIEDAIQTVSHHGIDALMSGDIPPNPSELLGSARMGKLLDELKKDYDYIFVDLPPVGVVSDALAISKFLSGVVLVVRSGSTNRDEVVDMVRRLEFVECNILGVILNDVASGGGKRKKAYDKRYAYGYEYSTHHMKHGKIESLRA